MTFTGKAFRQCLACFYIGLNRYLAYIASECQDNVGNLL